MAVADPKQASSASATAVAASSRQPDTLAEQQDLGRQAQKAGFMVGASVSEKKAEAMDLYQVLSIDHTEAKLGLLQDGRVLEEKTLPTTALLENWRLHKGKVTAPLQGWDPAVNPCSPLCSGPWLSELTKGAIGLALKKQWVELQTPLADLELLQNPPAVKVSQAFAKGGLTLVGASQRVEKGRAAALTSPAAVGVGSFEVPDKALYQVSPHFVGPHDSKGNPAKHPWVVPFWSVEIVKNAGEGNMELQFVATSIAELVVQVPVLVNKVALKPGDHLYWHRDGAKRIPASKAVVAASKAAGKAAAAPSGDKGGPAAKRPKVT